MNNIVIEHARIFAKNFSGLEGRFNPPGRRNFCVALDPDIADKLALDGWNVRHPRNEDPEDPRPYLPVTVSFANHPPKILVKSSCGAMLVDEGTVGRLDHDEYSDIKMVLNPYCWEVNGNSGVKAYLKSMICVMAEDDLEREINSIMSAPTSDEESPF